MMYSDNRLYLATPSVFQGSSTGLILACRENHYDIAQLLLENGAAVDQVDRVSTTRTP